MKRLRVADLFCGAGGFSEGCKEAAEALGYEVDLTAINHWPVAIETHRLNHPTANSLCTGVDAVNPRLMYAEGELDGLLASPECTNHSQAKGGKPICDQSRSTAHCVTRWVEATCPSWVVIENVPEFQQWGPLIKVRCETRYVRALKPGERPKKGEEFHSGEFENWDNKRGGKRKVRGVKVSREWRPDPKRKGETFRAWLATLQSLGYKTSYRVMCSADYGDPTTRKRLIIQAVRGRRKICWPKPTNSETGDPSIPRWWQDAYGCIDWTLEGKWVHEMKPKDQHDGLPMSAKTLERIQIGLLKEIELMNGKMIDPFVVSWDHQSGTGNGRCSQPLSSVTTKARHGVIKPYLIELRGTEDGQVRSSAKSLSKPVGTVTAGGVHHGLLESFLVQTAHGNGGDPNGNQRRTRRLSELMPAVCGNRGDCGLVDVGLRPMVLGQQSGAVARPVDEPCPTVATAGVIRLIQPYLVKYYGADNLVPLLNRMETLAGKRPKRRSVPEGKPKLEMPIVEIHGVTYQILLRWRMLQPHELALAQGFTRDYQFAGTKTDRVKQIGNAVTRRMVRAVIASILSQKEDVSFLLSEDDGKAVAA